MKTFRPRLAKPVSYTLVVLPAVASIVHVATSGPREASITIALGALVATYGIVAYAWPAVLIGTDEITVRNVFSTVTVPIARIAYVDTRWALEIYTDSERKVTSFAAPAPGVWTARQTRGADLENLHPDTYVGGGARIGDRPGTDSGNAAALVREAVSQWREAHGHPLPDDSTPTVRRRVNVRALVLIGAAAGAMVIAVTL